MTVPMKRRAPTTFSFPPAKPVLEFTVRALRATDADTVRKLTRERWGESVVAHGTIYHPERLPGFVAESAGAIVGLITYHNAPGAWEIVTLDSFRGSQGVATALVDALALEARGRGQRRLWLCTTNDNLDALRFYQRRGFALVAVHRCAVDASRKLKRTIPIVGAYGIPIRDEFELERLLEPETGPACVEPESEAG